MYVYYVTKYKICSCLLYNSRVGRVQVYLSCEFMNKSAIKFISGICS